MRTQQRKGMTNHVIVFAAALAVGIVSVVVLAILLNALQSTSVTCTGDGVTYNSSDDSCQNSSGSRFAKTTTGNITTNGLGFLSNTTSQFGTSGTVLGVSLLLVIIGAVGVGGYKAYAHFR